MKCVFCSDHRTSVKDSRPDGNEIRRRRECRGCGRRFSTIERADCRRIMVLKKNGSLEEFDDGKVLGGARKACAKRPIPSGEVEAIVKDIAKDLLAGNKPQIPSSVIGDMVMERLRTLDGVAYIRFASVYLPLSNIGEIEREIESLRAGRSRGGVPVGQLPLLPELSPTQSPRHSKRRRRRSAPSPEPTPLPRQVLEPKDRTGS